MVQKIADATHVMPERRVAFGKIIWTMEEVDGLHVGSLNRRRCEYSSARGYPSISPQSLEAHETKTATEEWRKTS